MSNGDRLDRIELALDQLRQRQEETQSQLDRQVPVMAELRTSMAELRASTVELRASVEALLQVATIHQQNFERLISEFQRHRSDGHGA